MAESGEDAQKWHLARGRKRRKNRSSASALRWLKEKTCLVCHIFAPFSDTSVHITDLSGQEAICCVTEGRKVKADRDEYSSYASMLAT